MACGDVIGHEQSVTSTGHPHVQTCRFTLPISLVYPKMGNSPLVKADNEDSIELMSFRGFERADLDRVIIPRHVFPQLSCWNTGQLELCLDAFPVSAIKADYTYRYFRCFFQLVRF